MVRKKCYRDRESSILFFVFQPSKLFSLIGLGTIFLLKIGPLRTTLKSDFNFQGKSTPYEFDIKIPFYVRGPDIRRRTNRDRQKPNPIVLNIDIAPTLLGFAGITPPAHMDGLNMAGVLRGFFTETRDTFLIEKKPRPVADKSLKDENQQRASELIDKECQQNPRKYKARRSRGSNKTNPECSNDQVLLII